MLVGLGLGALDVRAEVVRRGCEGAGRGHLLERAAELGLEPLDLCVSLREPLL
jgi:hypothetical protein